MDKDLETSILLPGWSDGPKVFDYLSQNSAVENLESDVDSELINDGYTAVDEETQETVIDEENVVVRTIRSITESVLDFFRGIFS